MNCPFTQQIGVYVLGRLNAADRHDLERHLPSCDRCRSELRDFQSLLPLLSAAREQGLTIGGARREASAELLERTLRAVAVRRAHRMRRVFASAAAALVIATGTGIGIVVSTSGPGTPPPATQVSAPAASRTTILAVPGGTQVELTLTGLPANTSCHLVLHTRDGSSETVSSWHVTYPGPVEVRARSQVRPEDIASLDVVDDSDRSLVLVAAPAPGTGTR